jgi:hypothetical protein
MKQENYRNKRKLNAITTALMGNFLYILVVLILKGILDALGNTGTYHLVYGIVEFVLISLFLVLFNWLSFRNAAKEDNHAFGKYLILAMIPILVMTIISIIVTYAGTSGDFSGNWNAMTFAISPTLFWYLPYGLIYFLTGSTIPIAAFMFICLVYMILLECLGYAMGAKSRAYSLEREQKRLMQDRKSLERQDAMAQQRSEQARQADAQAWEAARRDVKDPLGDVDQPAVIQTEAFTSITDDMIEEAVRNQKIKTAGQKAPLQRRNGARSVNPTQKKNVSVVTKQRKQNRDLSRELDEIRRKMEKKD